MDHFKHLISLGSKKLILEVFAALLRLPNSGGRRCYQLVEHKQHYPSSVGEKPKMDHFWEIRYNPRLHLRHSECENATTDALSFWAAGYVAGRKAKPKKIETVDVVSITGTNTSTSTV